MDSRTDISPLSLKGTSVKNYVIILTAIAILILLGTFAFMLSRYENVHFTDDIDRKLKSSEALFTSYLESDALMMGNALELILRDEKLKAAMKARDRRTLLTLSQTIFEQLHSKAYVTHFYFSGSDRVNILRVHKPERYGDKIDRFTTLQAEKTGKLFYGIELGPLGTFTLRVVVPWFDDKQLIGYVELGEEIEHIIVKLHNILNTELYVLIEKQYLKRTDWETGMKILGNNAEWDRFPSVVLIARTQKIFPDELSQVFSNTQYIPMMKRMEIIMNKSHYSANFARLKDAGNRDVGTMVIMHDVTDILAEYRKDLYFAVAICFLVGTFLLLALNIFFGRMEKKLGKLRRKNELILQSSGEGIFGLDLEGNHEFVNPAATQMLGYTVDELIGRHSHTAWHYKKADGSPYPEDECPMYATSKDGRFLTITDEVFWRKDGTSFPVEYNTTPIIEDENIIGTVVTFNDISERKHMEEELRALSLVDELTGLYNRRGFLTLVKQQTKIAAHMPTSN